MGYIRMLLVFLLLIQMMLIHQYHMLMIVCFVRYPVELLMSMLLNHIHHQRHLDQIDVLFGLLMYSSLFYHLLTIFGLLSFDTDYHIDGCVCVCLCVCGYLSLSRALSIPSMGARPGVLLEAAAWE